MIADIAGPEKLGIDEAVRRYLAGTGDPRKVITDAQAPYCGIEMKARSLAPEGEARVTTTRLADWLGGQRVRG